MKIEPENCALNANGYCMDTDKQCVKACRYATKKYPKLTLHDHLECYWRKRERIEDLLTRWVAVATGIAALTISIFTYWATHAKGP